MGLVGLVGEAGIGKSTLALELKNILGGSTQIWSFGQSLRLEISRHIEKEDGYLPNNIPDNARQGYLDVMEDSTKLYTKPTSPNIRALLQWWGTDYRRQDDPAYWLRYWASQYPMNARHVIVDDVRFLNEADLIYLFGGNTVRLKRDGFARTPGVHVSECIDDWWTDELGMTFELADDASKYGRSSDAIKFLGRLYASNWV
jgi:energy-coupling factor transporter ATP-binding protein EcfA2